MNDWQNSGHQKQRSWWSRNWFWAVPLGCLAIPLGCVALIGGAAVLGIHSLGGSDAIDLAFERLSSDPLVIEALGEPIEKTWLAGGNVNVHMSGGESVFRADIPLKGPKGKAIAHVQATKESGEWQLKSLEVEVSESGEWILLDTGAVPPAGNDEAEEPVLPLEDPDERARGLDI